jgi:hypothetical protein
MRAVAKIPPQEAVFADEFEKNTAFFIRKPHANGTKMRLQWKNR